MEDGFGGGGGGGRMSSPAEVQNSGGFATTLGFHGVWKDNMGKEVTFTVQDGGRPGESIQGSWSGGACEGEILESSGWGLRAEGYYSETQGCETSVRVSAEMNLGKFKITLDP